MTGLLGKEQGCCTGIADLVEVTRKRSSILNAKYCSDIQIWIPWPKDRRQMSQPQDNTIVGHQHVLRPPNGHGRCALR